MQLRTKRVTCIICGTKLDENAHIMCDDCLYDETEKQ